MFKMLHRMRTLSKHLIKKYHEVGLEGTAKVIWFYLGTMVNNNCHCKMAEIIIDRS